VPYGAGSGGALRSLTVTRVTLTSTTSSIEGDHTNGKDGVAGSIPACTRLKRKPIATIGRRDVL